MHRNDAIIISLETSRPIAVTNSHGPLAPVRIGFCKTLLDFYNHTREAVWLFLRGSSNTRRVPPICLQGTSKNRVF